MMDCPVCSASVEVNVKHCGKYRLSFSDGEGHVMIQAEDGPWRGSLWNAMGEETKQIRGYLDAGKPGRAEAYIDGVLKQNRERWKMFDIWSVDMHDI